MTRSNAGEERFAWRTKLSAKHELKKNKKICMEQQQRRQPTQNSQGEEEEDSE
jgi:hypothetical protein